MPDGYVNQCKACAYAAVAIWLDERRRQKAIVKAERLAALELLPVEPIRTCRKCNLEKSLEEFAEYKSAKSGKVLRLRRCESCESMYQSQWRKNNVGKIKAKYARYKAHDRRAQMPPGFLLKCQTCKVERELSEFGKLVGAKFGVRRTCTECLNSKAAAKYLLHPEAARIKSARWASSNPELASEIRKKSYRKHKSERLAYRKEWRANNLAKDKERERLYALNNPSVMRAKNARRRAAQTNACPAWLNLFDKAQMAMQYEIAIAREMQTGIKHHVDHIVPLRGLAVSGLHVPWNLQAITEFANCSKHNRLLDVGVA